MTRDYSKRAAPPEKPEKLPLPAWIPFFYGFLLGACLVAVGWVVFTPPGTPLVMPDYLAGSSDIAEIDINSRDEEQTVEKPRFDFYTILPEMEVVISDQETAQPVLPEAPVENADTRYRLQVGSFRKIADADRQKARLALLGVEAEIQKVDIGQGDIYYRVLTTPIDSRSQLNEQRRMFQKNNINSLVVQIRG